jgi:hypothetical protein
MHDRLRSTLNDRPGQLASEPIDEFIVWIVSMATDALDLDAADSRLGLKLARQNKVGSDRGSG